MSLEIIIENRDERMEGGKQSPKMKSILFGVCLFGVWLSEFAKTERCSDKLHALPDTPNACMSFSNNNTWINSWFDADIRYCR